MKKWLSCKMLGRIILFLVVTVCFLSSGSGSMKLLPNASISENVDPPKIIINIEPNELVFEGDIIDCEISGDPMVLYWQIDNQSYHDTFLGNCPVIFDPEPTPLGKKFVNLTVYAENEHGNDSATVKIELRRIFFGDY